MILFFDLSESKEINSYICVILHYFVSSAPSCAILRCLAPCCAVLLRLASYEIMQVSATKQSYYSIIYLKICSLSAGISRPYLPLVPKKITIFSLKYSYP